MADGDTITVLVNRKQIRIRLHGIDAPERRQPFNDRAKRFLSEMVFERTVNVEEMDVDRYGRVVGIVRLWGGQNVNHELLKAGLAWWFVRYARASSHGHFCARCVLNVSEWRRR